MSTPVQSGNLKIPKRLENIHGLYHNLFADDITLWATGGSDAEMKEILQMGIDVV